MRAGGTARGSARVDELDKRGTPPDVAPVNLVDGADALLRGHGASLPATRVYKQLVRFGHQAVDDHCRRARAAATALASDGTCLLTATAAESPGPLGNDSD